MQNSGSDSSSLQQQSQQRPSDSAERKNKTEQGDRQDSNKPLGRIIAAYSAHYALGMLDVISDLLVVLFFLVTTVYGVYSIVDTNRILQTADRSNFETYRPTKEETVGFDELHAINPEVIGWITLYGTQVDYPLLYSSESGKYLNMDAEGKFTLSGSIFLDAMNHPDMTDHKTIIYGHHMEEEKMFGGLDRFRDETYFEEHPYGEIYFDGKAHGLEIFSYFNADAYDWNVYDVIDAEHTEDMEKFLMYVDALTVWGRDSGVTAEDRVVLLSTCAGETNGRYLLAAKITDEVYENTFKEEPVKVFRWLRGPAKSIIKMLPLWWWVLLPLMFLLLFLFIRRKLRK